MSGLIKKPHELKVVALIKALLYGPPGIGKSTLALSAPKPLYVDCDRGVHRVSPYHQTDTIEVDKWEDVTAILTIDLSDYETLIVDTAGKMLMFMNEFVGRMNGKNKQQDGSLTQKGYGVRKQLFLEFLKKVADLGKHIVFVAHDKEDKKGDVVYVRPDVGGSSGQDLVRELDLVGYIEPLGSMRTISFDPVEGHYGKNTIGLPSMIELPNVHQLKNDFLTTIFKKFEVGVTERHDLGVVYNKLIFDIKARVDAIKKPDQANEVYKWLNEHTGHIWNSLYEGKMMVVAKAKELGFIANTTSRLFELPSAAPPGENGSGKPLSKKEQEKLKNTPANANVAGEAKQGLDPVLTADQIKANEGLV